MTDTPAFKPQDVKRARFLREFIEETERAILNLEMGKAAGELEKLTFLRTMLNNPSCTRKRRDEIDELIRIKKEEFDQLKDQSRTLNNELEIFKRTYLSLPERLRELASIMPVTPPPENIE